MRRSAIASRPVLREQWLKRWQCRFLIYEPVTSPDAAQFIGGRVTCASTESQAERSSNGPRPPATFLRSSAVVRPHSDPSRDPAERENGPVHPVSPHPLPFIPTPPLSSRAPVEGSAFFPARSPNHGCAPTCQPCAARRDYFPCTKIRESSGLPPVLKSA